MLLAVVLLIVGAVVLIAGAESAVRGTARFATLAGVPAFVLGALLFGIDIEGLAAVLLAAGRGQTELAAGEAFGAMVFLFGVGFAFALLLSRGSIKAPAPLMVVLPAVCLTAAALVVADQYVTRAEGVALVVLYAAYVWVVVIQRGGVDERARELERGASVIPGGPGRAVVIAVLGIAAVYGGAWMLVQGGVRIVTRTGLTAGFVGAAILGTLASLDEVFLEVLPVMRGAPEVATGHLFGTVAAFSTVVLGLAALIHPLQLDPAAVMSFLAAALLYVIVAIAFLVRGELSKPLAFVLLAAYVGWLGYTVSL